MELKCSSVQWVCCFQNGSIHLVLENLENYKRLTRLGESVYFVVLTVHPLWRQLKGDGAERGRGDKGNPPVLSTFFCFVIREKGERRINVYSVWYLQVRTLQHDLRAGKQAVREAARHTLCKCKLKRQHKRWLYKAFAVSCMCVFCLIYGPAVLGHFRLVCTGDISFHVSLFGAH